MKFKIALVGEAWGAEEEAQRLPFCGAAGYQLNQLLNDADIKRSDCYVTNVFNLRPAGNDLETLCTTKTGDHLGDNWPAVRTGKYIRREFLPELERLSAELAAESPNLVVALGGTAAWALLRDARITKIRGTIASSFDGRHKTLPTYHPAAILRQWELRHVTILDLMKAKKEAEYPEIRRPRREIWIEPTIEDLWTFYNEHLLSARYIAPDIETQGNAITCIGFAPRIDLALVVPFWDPRRPGCSYWPTAEAEAEAWRFVAAVLDLPAVKIFHNGVFDINHLWRNYGIPVRNADEDTMLMHHALQPESLKGLGFLGSVYTSESGWKLMRQRGELTIKRDN